MYLQPLNMTLNLFSVLLFIHFQIGNYTAEFWTVALNKTLQYVSVYIDTSN